MRPRPLAILREHRHHTIQLGPAFQHPRQIDTALVDAQQARRVLDRLVGYKISPLLWSKVRRGLSAGRVQSVALRMVVDREREILGFNAKEYWTLDALLAKAGVPNTTEFSARLRGQTGKRNFEMGVWTESAALIDGVLEQFNALWEGCRCETCKRQEVCPVPLEEPELA